MRIRWTLLILGAYAQIAQALLIRENLVVFYGNEVSLGAFFGSWLLWMAVGSWLAVRWRQRGWLQEPLPVLRSLVLALPLLLAVQILVTRMARHFLEASSAELVPLGELWTAVALITLPTGLVLGLSFPLGCQLLARLNHERPPDVQDPPQRFHFNTEPLSTKQAVRNVSSLYVFDALGSLLGGILFTLVLVEWLGVWKTFALVTLTLALAASLLDRRSPRTTRLTMFVAGLGLILLMPPLSQWVEEHSENLRFAALQPGLKLLEAQETRYGHVAIAELGSQRSVVVDGRIVSSFPDPEQAQQDAAR